MTILLLRRAADAPPGRMTRLSQFDLPPPAESEQIPWQCRPRENQRTTRPPLCSVIPSIFGCLRSIKSSTGSSTAMCHHAWSSTSRQLIRRTGARKQISTWRPQELVPQEICEGVSLATILFGVEINNLGGQARISSARTLSPRSACFACGSDQPTLNISVATVRSPWQWLGGDYGCELTSSRR
jgi:hypothetical protein